MSTHASCHLENIMPNQRNKKTNKKTTAQKEQITALTAQKEVLETDITNINAQKAALEAEIIRINEHKATQISNCQTINNQITELTTQKRTLETETTRINISNLESKQQAEKYIASMNPQIKRAEKNRDATIKRYKQEATKFQQEHLQVKTNLEQKTQELQKITKLKDETILKEKAEQAKHSQEIRDLNKKLIELNIDVPKKQKELDQLEQEYKTTTEKLAAATNKIEIAEKHLIAIAQQVKTAETNRDTIVSQCKIEIDKLQQEHTQTQESLKLKTQEHQKSIAELVEKATETKKQLASELSSTEHSYTTKIEEFKEQTKIKAKVITECQLETAKIQQEHAQTQKSLKLKTQEQQKAITELEEKHAKAMQELSLQHKKQQEELDSKISAKQKALSDLEQQQETAKAKIKTQTTTAETQTTTSSEKDSQTEKQTIANKSALGVSYIAGFIACIYSGTIQKMLFGKLFFGNALLLGYAAPAVNLVMASMAFGLIAFGLTLTVISIAKSAEDKPIFRGFTENSYFRILLITAAFLTITKYAIVIQLALFSTVLLGGTALANLSFALIATTLVCSFLALASAEAIPKEYRFGLTMYALSFIALSIYASPALLGPILIFIPPMLSNISFGAIASLITAPILTALYKTTELVITPTVMDPAKKAEQFAEGASKIVSTCTATLSSFASSYMPTL